MSLGAAPKVTDLVGRPGDALRLPACTASDLLGECETELARWQRLRDLLLIRAAVGNVSPNGGGDRLLGVEEAAERLGRSTDWLYRNARSLPFTVQETKGGRLRFSAAGIERYIRERQGV